MSEVRTDLVSNRLGTGPAPLFRQNAAKAHCVVNNAGGLSSPSLNVSSVIDVGTGTLDINFANAMSGSIYTPTVASSISVATPNAHSTGLNSATQVRHAYYVNGVFGDPLLYFTSVHGDLA